jgi:hypothetical protein
MRPKLTALVERGRRIPVVHNFIETDALPPPELTPEELEEEPDRQADLGGWCTSGRDRRGGRTRRLSSVARCRDRLRGVGPEPIQDALVVASL